MAGLVVCGSDAEWRSFHEICGKIWKAGASSFVADGVPDRFRLTVTTPLTRSITMSLACVLTLSGLAADKGGCFLTAFGGDLVADMSRLSGREGGREGGRVKLGVSLQGRTFTLPCWAYESLRPDGADDEEGPETGNNAMWHLVSCGT